jgi:hypothetical protein
MSNLDTLQVDDSIQLERQGSILTLWLNRPESRNAMSLNMVNAIQQVFAHIAEDSSIRAVICVEKAGISVQVVILKIWQLCVLKRRMWAVYSLMLILTAVLVP